MPIQAPKMGVLRNFGPVNVIIHHRDPKKVHPCVNPRLLSYQLYTYTQLHTHNAHAGEFIFCPCIALDRQQCRTTQLA